RSSVWRKSIPTIPRQSSAGAPTQSRLRPATGCANSPAKPRGIILPLRKGAESLTLEGSTHKCRAFAEATLPAAHEYKGLTRAMKALSKVTRSIKLAEVEKKWHLTDADGLVVGRLAAIV